MKFKINRDHFSSGLQQVLNIVSTRAPMPILGNVLIEAEGEHVSLATTNMDMGIRCRIKASVLESGSITLPVRKVATIVRELPNIDVELETTEGHQAKIASGGSHFKIMGISSEEFPALPSLGDEQTFILEQRRLFNMLKSVAYAQSADETRYILNGVYFNFAEDKLNLVATDGRRLAIMSTEVEVLPEQAGSIIIPAKTITELMRVLEKGENVKIAFSDQQVVFEVDTEKEAESAGLAGSIYLVSKVVEGNYPNYRQVIPKETHHRIKVDRELFLQCIHRAALVTNDKSNSVRIKVANNLLEITASTPDLGEAHESMAVPFDDPEVEVAFNPQFLMDPLRALTQDEVYFEIKDEVSPGVFKTLESFLCVVMPLRLK